MWLEDAYKTLENELNSTEYNIQKADELLGTKTFLGFNEKIGPYEWVKIAGLYIKENNFDNFNESIKNANREFKDIKEKYKPQNRLSPMTPMGPAGYHMGNAMSFTPEMPRKDSKSIEAVDCIVKRTQEAFDLFREYLI